PSASRSPDSRVRNSVRKSYATCGNDLDAKGTKDQIIYQKRVRSADRLLFKPKDRVDFAAPPTAGSNGSGAVSGLSVHFTAGSSQLMHCRSVRPEMVTTGTIRF